MPMEQEAGSVENEKHHTLQEELAHIRYLLTELETWTDIPPRVRKRLRIRYLRRQRELEVALGLRSPPLTPDAARELAWQLNRAEQLFFFLKRWERQGWLDPEAGPALAFRLRRELAEGHARLKEAEIPVPSFTSLKDWLGLLRATRAEVERLQRETSWLDEAHVQDALDDLDAAIAGLETELGLRPRPRAKLPPAPPKVPPAAPSPPPRPPRQPLTWEKVWQTLLSERTLRTLLFIGAFLVFASAVTLVVYNWERFSPWTQVAILSAFTLFFYGLGWYVRGPMRLRNSGIALTATASLLVPVDFYAVYLSGGIFPRDAWAEVWWLTSAVCLVAYTFTALRVRAEFFGYLVGVALGSLLTASLQIAGVSSDVWSPFVGGLALGLLAGESLWPQVFQRPFRHLALLTTAAAALLTTGLWLAARGTDGVGLPFRTALAVDWWLAAATLGLGTARYQWEGPRVAAPFLSATCLSLPLASYTTLTLLFERRGTPAGWHALALALLALAYVGMALRLRPRLGDAQENGILSRTLLGWATALGMLATGWGLMDMAAASATHAALAVTVALAVWGWRLPHLLPLTSLLALSAGLTGATTQGLDVAEYGLVPASIALLHVMGALALAPAAAYTARLYGAALVLGALALIPPLGVLDRPWLIYTLGHFILLSGWMAALSHTDQHPGLDRLLPPSSTGRMILRGRSLLHWITAIPIPLWFGLFWSEYIRREDAWEGLALSGLAALLFWASRRMVRRDRSCGLPWAMAGVLAGALGGALSLYHYDPLPVLLTLLVLSALSFAYGAVLRRGEWLAVGGLILPWGYGLALDYLGVPADPLRAMLAVPPALYLLVGVWLEHRGTARSFLRPLHIAGHLVALAAFCAGWVGLVDSLTANVPWSDEARLWTVAGQLVLLLAYGTLAWFWRAEWSGHIATWLGVCAGGLVATVYSQGRGSSAARAAFLAILYVLTERALFVGRHSASLRALLPTGRHAASLRAALRKGLQAVGNHAWPIFRRPLLIAGWAVSGGAVFLALVRNLVILGGGPVRENWAIVALLMVVALYGASAWMFRRPLFLWLAAPLLIAPWTILTHRGWYLWEPPPLPRYGLAWVVLAGLLLAGGQVLRGRYGTPLRVTAHLLLPFALIWGAADRITSSVTFGLAVAFYAGAALADHRRGRKGLASARFLYPAAFLLPIWGIYLLARFRPDLPQTHFGILLLLFGPFLFSLGRLLHRVQPADALPASLAGYASALAGTMVVSPDRPLLVLALLWNTGLSLISVVALKEPAWGYPAAAFPAGALLLALAERGFPPDWRGLWLVGMSAVYLMIAGALRRLPIRQYATPPMVTAYTVMALGLPISGYDPLAAAWTFGAAAVLYALSAFWLREPLFLTPAAGLAPVPYTVALQQAAWIPYENWGLALWPGIQAAGALGWGLDRWGGEWPEFPWGQPARWLSEAARRLTGWWPLAPYLLAALGTVAAVSWSWEFPLQRAAAFALAALACGGALWRFRRRGWLMAILVGAHGAWWSLVAAAARGQIPLPDPWPSRLTHLSWAAFAFLPASLATLLVGLTVQRRWGEGPPFGPMAWPGWSRPFYWLLLLDMAAVQMVGIRDSHPGTLISLTHTAILGALAVVWSRKFLAYGAVVLGLVALMERLVWAEAPLTDFPVALALLALFYGVVGYLLEYGRRGQPGGVWRVLEEPLRVGGQILAATAISWALAAGLDVGHWLVRALLGRSLPTREETVIVQMVVLVLALTGLMYLTASLVRRWSWRGYGAVAMLLVAWSLEWFLVWGQREVQGYAVPAGVYLLGVGYLEWRQGRKTLGRWIDRAAVLLLLGSSFYQSLSETYGWPYALLMGAEGLLLVWWGSARRQRQFLYTGTLGVVLAVTGQLLRELFTITNAWIAFGVPGLVILALVIWIERRLERLRELSQEWRGRLERWE